MPPSDQPEMVTVPAGRFVMGSPDDEPGRLPVEGPQRTVSISRPFAAGRYPVTVAQYAAFVAATRHDIGTHALLWTGADFADQPGSYAAPGFAQDGEHPAVCVGWHDANAYAAWLARETGRSYRLLTEAEWEYAARAGTSTPFWWGRSITPGDANYNATQPYGPDSVQGEWLQRTVPVQRFAASAWGLCQMHGNVWEWVQDGWRDSYAGASADGTAVAAPETETRVLRGGSWLNGGRGLRAARRHGARPEFRRSDIGFRVACTL